MSALQVNDLSPIFGAEISGLNPRIPIYPATIAALRKLFDEKGLLVFRGLDDDAEFQSHLSGILVGEAEVQDDAAQVSPDRTSHTLVSNRKGGQGSAPFGRLLFHTDMMWAENPFRLISLYGIEVEQPTVPTLFASTVHAWNTLPADLRARVEGRFAIHGRESRTDDYGEVLVTTFGSEQTVELPIARRHPHTGETMLYVDQRSTYGIAGLSSEESDDLMAALHAHLYRPENVVEHQWRQGDLVLWDNLALQHARPNVKLEGPVRVLRKVYAPKAQISRENRPEYSIGR
jgi:alpha-ketoglutarate-dependent taurine dioxygenase